MKKGLKTPLRYPGGKSRAVTKMGIYFPNLRDYIEYMVMKTNKSFTS